MFFFSSRRRHTRSKRDWSSDVCSSDLRPGRGFGKVSSAFEGFAGIGLRLPGVRSEERRVGKECRSRWSADHEKKKEKHTAYALVSFNRNRSEKGISGPICKR